MKVKKEFCEKHSNKKIDLFEIDLKNANEVNGFFEYIQKNYKDYAICFVFEGILYYLSEEVEQNILSSIIKIKNPNIFIIKNTWPIKLKNSSVFKKFIKFTNENVEAHDFRFHNLPEDIVTPGFEILNMINYEELYRKYLNIDIKNKNELPRCKHARYPLRSSLDFK